MSGGRRHVDFPGGSGAELAGTLDLPDGTPVATALLAHCFTCDRTSRASSRVARALVEAGYAVLRFDFTGLGDSEGAFGDTTFTTNLADLRAAVAWLGEELEPPALLVGHSLGGAAVLAVGGEMEHVRAVAVIGAPATPGHAATLLEGAAPAPDGHLEVVVGQRTLHVSPELAADLADQPQAERIAGLDAALLVLHSPRDQVVGVDEARVVYDTARHPKSFVSLDGADHLLLEPGDADFAGRMIAVWASRYLPAVEVGEVEVSADDAASSGAGGRGPVADGSVVVDELDAEDGYAHRVTAGGHAWVLDEPADVGGGDTGPGPYEVLLSALGACTSMTMRMYARRKGWDYPPARVTLRHERIHAADCEHCATTSGRLDRVHRLVEIDPSVPEEHRARLLEMADRCPVHRTLLGEVDIVTTDGSGD